MFIKRSFCGLLLYVDDIILVASNPKLLQSFITNLHNKFAMKDLVPLSFFLGIEATWYITDLLQHANMLGSKLVSTPTPQGFKLTLYDGDPLVMLPSILVGAL